MNRNEFYMFNIISASYIEEYQVHLSFNNILTTNEVKDLLLG